MSKKIRFLATGDIHSDKKLLNNISKYNNFEEIDFILVTGDLSEKKNDFKHILSTFKEKPIFMVPGNHESKKQLDILKNEYHIHLLGNYPVKITSNLVLFGSDHLNVGPISKSEQKIFDNLVENFNSIKDIKCKILLSHVPPNQSQIGDASVYFPFIGGSEAVNVFLENFDVDLSLVGHIHESSGLEEIVYKNKVLNVGRTSKILEFDVEKKELNIIN